MLYRVVSPRHVSKWGHDSSICYLLQSANLHPTSYDVFRVLPAFLLFHRNAKTEQEASCSARSKGGAHHVQDGEHGGQHIGRCLRVGWGDKGAKIGVRTKMKRRRIFPCWKSCMSGSIVFRLAVTAIDTVVCAFNGKFQSSEGTGDVSEARPFSNSSGSLTVPSTDGTHVSFSQGIACLRPHLTRQVYHWPTI